ncbi:hypothetical protein ACLOJK_023923 [Asimina triloba]
MEPPSTHRRRVENRQIHADHLLHLARQISDLQTASSRPSLQMAISGYRPAIMGSNDRIFIRAVATPSRSAASVQSAASNDRVGVAHSSNDPITSHARSRLAVGHRPCGIMKEQLTQSMSPIQNQKNPPDQLRSDLHGTHLQGRPFRPRPLNSLHRTHTSSKPRQRSDDPTSDQTATFIITGQKPHPPSDPSRRQHRSRLADLQQQLQMGHAGHQLETKITTKQSMPKSDLANPYLHVN